MEKWQGLEHIPADLGDTVVTIGVFDGIHLGHQQLIRQAVADGKRRGLPVVLMTFTPNPVALFAPDKAPASLSTTEHQCALAAELGVDAVLVVKFDRQFAAISPEDFVGTILAEKLHAVSVYVGENFNYGARAAGSADTLPGHCREHAIEAHVVSLVEMDTEGASERVSSTRIRGYLDEGKVADAATLLGRPHRIEGEIVHGQGRGGAQLGFPTANIDFSPGIAVPADGVYAAWFTAMPGQQRDTADKDGDIELGVRYPAAVSVGTNVTFGDSQRTVEAFILDRHADLYGLWGVIEFVDWIRGMEKFDGIEPLIERMNLDVEQTRGILGISGQA